MMVNSSLSLLAAEFPNPLHNLVFSALVFSAVILHPYTFDMVVYVVLMQGFKYFVDVFFSPLAPFFHIFITAKVRWH